jgi:hypothetical protein
MNEYVGDGLEIVCQSYPYKEMMRLLCHISSFVANRKQNDDDTEKWLLMTGERFCLDATSIATSNRPTVVLQTWTLLRRSYVSYSNQMTAYELFLWSGLFDMTQELVRLHCGPIHSVSVVV